MALDLIKFIKGIVVRNDTDMTKQVQIQVSNSANTNTKTTIETAQTVDRTVTMPDATDTLVGKATTDTLSNKTLDNSTVATIQDTNLTLQDNGDITKQLKFELSGITAGQTRTLTAPDTSTTIVGTGANQTLSNKTIDNSNNITVKDSAFIMQDNVDVTKIASFQLSGISSGVSRSYTLPDANTTLVGNDTTQTLSNKTLDNTTTANVKDTLFTLQDDGDATKLMQFQLSGITAGNTRTLTVPDASTTLVGTATTQTLQNKTLDNTSTITVKDANLTLQDDADTTKQLQLQLSGISSGVTRTLTVPNASTTIVGTDATQTLTNKTLSGNTATNLISGSGTLTLNTSGTATVPNATDTLVGKATTDILTNKTMGDALAITQISTPSNPSSGFNKIYSKSDDSLYILTSAGVESKIGSGSSSGFNYIANPDAESSTTGFATYADLAGTSPVDGTGGSPASTFTRSTSSPLRGAASFLLTKSANNRQGEGFSYDFTIADADKGKVLQCNFDYAIASGTYADNDVVMYIYDVTNATLIQPAPYQLKNHSLVSDRMAFEFQTATNSNSYRVIFHISSTSALAYTLKFDNFNLGPQAKLYGSPITDLISFTPTGSWVSNTTYGGSYRRVGDSMEVFVNVRLSGAPTNASLTVNLPSGFSIDTTKLPTASGGLGPGDDRTGLGMGMYRSGNGGQVTVSYNTTTSVVIYALESDTTYTAIKALNATIPVTWASGNEIGFYYKVPIVGWSSSQVMSSDSTTRVLTARAVQNATMATVSGGTNTIVNFQSVTYDTHGAVTTGASWKYTAPVAGFYLVATRVQWSSASWPAGSFANLNIFKNGSIYANLNHIDIVTTATIFNEVKGATIVQLVAGDTIDIRVNHSQGTSLTTSGDTTADFVDIQLVQGPSQVAASESVNFHYSSSSAQVLTGGDVSNTITYPTKDYDSHNAVSSGVFTAPSSGKYQFTYAFNIATQGSGPSRIISQLLKNNATIVARDVTTVVSSNNSYKLTDTISMLAGETMRVTVQTDASTNSTLSSEQTRNYFSGNKVGN